MSVQAIKTCDCVHQPLLRTLFFSFPVFSHFKSNKLSDWLNYRVLPITDLVTYNFGKKKPLQNKTENVLKNSWLIQTLALIISTVLDLLTVYQTTKLWTWPN